jgi:hypothetical protein
MELLGRLQQRLGRNAAHVEAGAAERRLAILADEIVDAGGLQAKLRRADGGDIAGRAGADDDHVVVGGHGGFLQLWGVRLSLRQQGQE